MFTSRWENIEIAWKTNILVWKKSKSGKMSNVKGVGGDREVSAQLMNQTTQTVCYKPFTLEGML